MTEKEINEILEENKLLYRKLKEAEKLIAEVRSEVTALMALHTEKEFLVNEIQNAFSEVLRLGFEHYGDKGGVFHEGKAYMIPFIGDISEGDFIKEV